MLTFIRLLVVAVLLSSVLQHASAVNVTHNDTLEVTKEQRNALKRIGFIHITKTGGTAIEKSIYSKYLNSFGHKQTLVNYSHEGDVAICVIRHPVTRFISIYNYWRYGSEMYERESYWRPPVDSLNDFMSAWRDISHPKHKEIVSTLSGGRGFTWAAHFYPQSYWLPHHPITSSAATSSATAVVKQSIADRFGAWFMGKDTMKVESSKRNVIIVRHTNSRKRFARRVSAAFSFALSELNMTKSENDLQREKAKTAIPDINVSNRLINDTNSVGFISVSNMKWLKEYFKEDFDLLSSAKVQFYTGKGQWKAVF